MQLSIGKRQTQLKPIQTTSHLTVQPSLEEQPQTQIDSSSSKIITGNTQSPACQSVGVLRPLLQSMETTKICNALTSGGGVARPWHRSTQNLKPMSYRIQRYNGATQRRPFTNTSTFGSIRQQNRSHGNRPHLM